MNGKPKSDNRRTITMSGRPPIRINEADWPEVAVGSDSDHDGEIECQANRRHKWNIRVRQHKDGRAIVYGRYEYTSNWTKERDYLNRGGHLLSAECTYGDICTAIEDVGMEMASMEHRGDDAARWETVIRECVADLPPEELS